MIRTVLPTIMEELEMGHGDGDLLAVDGQSPLLTPSESGESDED